MRSKFKWIFTLLLAFKLQFSLAQEKTVTGVVSDNAGPTFGANVVVDGTKRGTQTDMDGKYSINVNQGETLMFSYIGMETQSIKVGSSAKINVKLVSSGAIKLDDVMITGALGNRKKKDAMTSSAQVVSSKELMTASNPNAIQSLAGKVSGLQINTTSNGANPTTSITLRGQRTITGNNQALVVIDGAISSAAILQQLPPDIIMNMSVLKGVQGAALYGEQGSNGVIVVTTKKGSDRKLTVNVSSSVDYQSVLFLPKRQTSYGQGWTQGSYDFNFVNSSDPRNGNSQWSPFENGAWGPAFNDPAWAGTSVPVGLPQANGTIFQTPWKSLGSDNIKRFFQTGAVVQNSVSLNAGSDEGYVSFNYTRTTNDFVVKDDGLKRNYFTLRAGKKSGKWKIDGVVAYTSQSNTYTDSNLLYDLLQTPTNVDVSMFSDSGTAHNWTVYARNPFQVIKQIRNTNETNNFNGNLKLQYDFSKNIFLTNNTNIQLNSNIYQYHNDGFNDNPYLDYSSLLTSASGNQAATYSDYGGFTQFEQSRYDIQTNLERKTYNDLVLNFNYKLTDNLGLTSFIGQNIQDDYIRYTEQGGNNLKVPGWYNMQNVSNPDSITSLLNGYTLTRKVATFVNADLNYKEYLFFNATGRYEETSTINEKKFLYYSGGSSFILTEAFKNLKGKTLNYAKIYANFSRVGNTSAVAPFSLTDVSYGASGYPYSYGGLISYMPRRGFVDPNILPEFVYSKEIGGQFNFLKDRIILDAAFYVNDTDQLITNATTSTTSGISSLQSNTGKLQNKGYEVNFNITPIETKGNGFKWNLRTGITQYKTIVKDLTAGTSEIALLSGSTVGIYAIKGEQYPSIKLSQFQTDASGNVIVGVNGIPRVTSTLVKSGNATPQYIINLSNTFSYKGFSLNVVADYRANYSIYSQTYNRMLFAGYTTDSAEFDRSAGYLYPNSVVNTSLPSTPVYATNTTAISPANLAQYYGTLSTVGQYSLFDASAVKVREISLAYTLPSKMLKHSGFTNVKFSVYARNPFIFFVYNSGKYGKKNQGYTDPEASTSSTIPGYSNVGQYPSTKSLGFSLNITL